jgi:septum formation protein
MLTRPIILGSGSPRRKEILSFFSLPFSQITSDFDEESITYAGDALLYVETLAEKKGESLSKEHPEDIIITADTIVYLDGKVYNKPKSKEEATSFLQELSGKWHTVYTAVALTHRGKQHAKTEKTNILFNELTDDHIEHYLAHVNFLDKAGSYAIQQGGSLVVKKIDGCYYNVMGLPINALQELLQLVNIDLWEYMRIL